MVLGGTYFLNSDNTQIADGQVKPWIEILKSGVSELSFDGAKIVRQLKTGDELQAPTIIKTNGIGLANIYFPNGSVARLDSDTELVLEQGSYDGKDKTLRVKILLSFGRVWSKIFELATPQSLWEVRTAHVVATVRGTAFGVEYLSDKTTIVGSEHSVSVTMIDPKTNAIIEDYKITLSEDQVMAISDESIEAVINGVAAIASAVRKSDPEKVLQSEWVERFEAADEALKEKIENIDEIESIKEIRKIILSDNPAKQKRVEILKSLETVEIRKEDLNKLPIEIEEPIDTSIQTRTESIIESFNGIIKEPESTKEPEPEILKIDSIDSSLNTIKL